MHVFSYRDLWKQSLLSTTSGTSPCMQQSGWGRCTV